MIRFGEIPISVCFWEVALAVASIATSVVSTGVGVAQAAGAFDEEEEGPVMAAGETEEQMRAKKLRSARMGKKQTWLTGGQEALGQAQVTRPALKQSLGA